jgi:acetoin utilization deacetylase AcuC-like enzyme
MNNETGHIEGHLSRPLPDRLSNSLLRDPGEGGLHSAHSSKFYPVVAPAAASEDDILLVHTPSILNSVKADQDLYRAAAMAAGGALMAAELACQGQPTFAAVRPPGHHASPDSHWGFCFFNNMAIAIEKLIRTRKVSQALVLDIDLHFGDGTDNLSWARREVVVANIQRTIVAFFGKC